MLISISIMMISLTIYIIYKNLCMSYETELNKVTYIAAIILLFGIIELVIAIYTDLRGEYLYSLYQQNKYFNTRFLIIEYPFIKDYMLQGNYTKQDFFTINK